MKTDLNGCSTCQPGQEQYESWGKELVQYKYRTISGKLFTCVAKSLESARQRRDNWLNN